MRQTVTLKQIANEIGVSILLDIYGAFSNTNNYYLSSFLKILIEGW